MQLCLPRSASTRAARKLLLLCQSCNAPELQVTFASSGAYRAVCSIELVSDVCLLSSRILIVETNIN